MNFLSNHERILEKEESSIQELENRKALCTNWRPKNTDNARISSVASLYPYNKLLNSTILLEVGIFLRVRQCAIQVLCLAK